MKSLIYKNSMKAFGLLVSLLICSCSFVSCDDDDDNGGSSVMSTIILFCIIQGMYVLNFEEEDQDGSKEQYQKEQRGRNTSAKRKRLSQTQVR